MTGTIVGQLTLDTLLVRLDAIPDQLLQFRQGEVMSELRAC